jgi:hypothetical protein
MKERIWGSMSAARPVSNAPFLGSRRRERQHPAATLDVRRALRQSKRSSTKRLTNGSLGEKADAAELRRMVVARMEFFSQARAASNSRCCAWRRMVKKRVRVARSCLLVSSVASAWGARLVMKRLKIGRAWGTTVAWQAPVPRMVAKM